MLHSIEEDFPNRVHKTAVLHQWIAYALGSLQPSPCGRKKNWLYKGWQITRKWQYNI